MTLNPNLEETKEDSTLLEFNKDQEYYNNLEINMEDLEALEERV